MEEEIRKDVSDLSEEALQKLLRKESPELLVMLPDLWSRLQSLCAEVGPWSEGVHGSPPTVDGKELSGTGIDFGDCKTQVTLNYCLLLATYMLLKSERRDVRQHPLMPLLVRSRALLDRLTALEPRLGDALFAKERKEEAPTRRRRRKSRQTQSDVAEEEEQFARFASRKRESSEVASEGEKSEKSEEENSAGEDAFYQEMVERKREKERAKEERKAYLEHYVNDDFELEEGESRKATQKILKNRGLVPSRPKENRNPRVKKRRRYEKALKRRKGQVAALRTNEADQYMGEKSGIRSDVTHSRLFR